MEQLAKKLMSWASILEDGTREQALRTAALPFIHPWVALMPDAHLGRGATVGSVIPTLGAIIPAAVGVDIGCGMIAVRSQFTARDVRARGDLAVLRESIENVIPLSAGQYNADVHDAGTERRIADLEERAGAGSAGSALAAASAIANAPMPRAAPFIEWVISFQLFRSRVSSTACSFVISSDD